MSGGVVTAAYIVAAILFIFSLAGLSRHETSQRGNLLGITGMAIALVATIFGPYSANIGWIIVAMVIGAVIGIRLARKVEMTEMPELVAVLHSFVGLAAVLVGFNSYMSDSDRANTLVEWDGLTRVTKHMFLRPNTLYHSYGFPLVFTHRMAADLRHCFDTGMMGVDYDSLIHHWGGNGLNYYVLSKLLWNPYADVDAIMADYCQSGFGPAAPAIQRYFDAVEQQTNRIAGINAWRRGKIPEQEMIPLWTKEVMQELQGHLDQAKTLAATDAAVLERIAVLQVGMDYVRLQIAAMTAIEQEKQEATPANKAAKQAALEARQQFYRQYKTSFAINVPMLLFRQQSRSDLFYGVNNEEAKRLLQQMEDEQA